MNRQQYLQYLKDWRRNHPDKVKEYQRRQNERRKQKRKTDLDYRRRRREIRKRYYERNKQRILISARRYSSNKTKSNFERGMLAKEAIISKLGGRCQECGFENPLALHIHHKTNKPKKRVHGISKWVYLYNHYNEEKDDIELLCANCHMIKHATRQSLFLEAKGRGA